MAGTWLQGAIWSPIPYCGVAPTPETLLGRWNLDPSLIAALALLFAAYLLGRRSLADARPSRTANRLAIAGWAVGALALISPLCPLSVSLFAARVGQHMVLTLLAAPLIALGRPGATIAAGLGLGWRPARSSLALPAALALAAMLWVWHAPGPYAATFESPFIYWMMHITTFGSALWLWCEILNRRANGASFAAAAFSMIQMGFLGALITLAAEPVYAPHRLTTAAWSLTQLEDQQLGGAIMWVPGIGVFLAVLSVIAWRALKPLLDDGRAGGPAIGRAA
jgi:putative membrane protein